MALFRDRFDAGQQLAQRLTQYAGQSDVVVLALPRGGVPVAYEVARALHAPLDIFLVRKLGVPGHEELAMGAIASGGVRVINRTVVENLQIQERSIDAVAREEQEELQRREQAYRNGRPPIPVNGKTAILIDDGLATGASMQAAVEGLQAMGPRRVIVAVPTAAPETCAAFERKVDEVVCAYTPQPFYGVGMWYEDFSQTTDAEVRNLLAQAARELNQTGWRAHSGNNGTNQAAIRRPVQVQAGPVMLQGDLVIPEGAAGIVAFVHGSGSSRHSPRNQYVAEVLQQGGLATLLFDLLTAREEQADLATRVLRFDIDLLARRTESVVEWLSRLGEARGMPIGLFGASTGAAAALIAAAQQPYLVRAVVSRGGRPDLAASALSNVHAPSMFIVGSEDDVVIRLNREAFAELPDDLPKSLEIVPGASHLFEEPGTLEEAARLAKEWFQRNLKTI